MAKSKGIFSKSLVMLLSGLMVFSISAPTVNAEVKEEPIKINIDTTKTERQIEPDSIFGINHRYAFNGYGTFDSKTMKVKDEFKKLYQDVGFGSIRYPGGTISNLFNWKTTLGEKQNRKKQIHGFYNYDGQGGIEPNFGIKEIADFADEVKSEIIYVYSLGRGSVKDAEDLVEFLNAKVGTNPNGGIDWAKVRADNGHPEPYNVRYFEIGNEMNQSWGEDGKGSQSYWTSYVKVPGGVEQAYIEGGTVEVDKRYTVLEENWNKKGSESTGEPNQVRHLRYANVNPGVLKGDKIVADSTFQAVNKGVRVFVGLDGRDKEWQVVENFDKSGSDSEHCVVDYSTGTIKFGDGKKGKIPDKGHNVYATYSVERDGFVDIAQAIKNTTDKINKKENKQLKANVYSSFESEGFIKRMKDLNKNDVYDGLTIHPYSGTVQNVATPEAFYDEAMKRAETSGVDHVQKYAKILPQGKVPVISEYGIFNNTQRQVRSQTHAVYIAKVLMEYVKLGSPYIQKHCLVDWYNDGRDALGPTQQAVIQAVKGEGADIKTGEGNFSFFATPSAHVFKMFNQGFGENILNTTLSKEPTMENGVKSLNTLTSMDKDGNIYVALVNVDRTNNQKVALNIKGVDVTGRKMQIQELKSSNIADENSLENPNNVKITTREQVATSNPEIELQKHSVAVVKIENKKISADKSKLENKVDEINQLVKENYTNFDLVEKVLENAQNILKDENATQKQVDDVYDALVSAQNSLELKKADYKVVEDVIAKIPVDLTIYTEETVKALNDAKEAVIYDLDITKQSQVNQMAKAIEDAIGALKEKPSKPLTPLEPSKPIKPEKPNTDNQKPNTEQTDNKKPQNDNTSNQNVQNDNKTQVTTPKTSDNENILLGMIALAGSIGALAVLKKRKKS